MKNKYYQIQQFIFDVLENRSKSLLGRFWEGFLFFLILFNVFFMTLETVKSLYDQYAHFFFWIDTISVIIFTIEYLSRIWTAPLKKGYAKAGGRFVFIFTPLMIFDLLVLLPFYIGLFFPITDTRWLRVFRLLRIFRVFRISRYSNALERVLNVARKEKEELAAIFTLMLILLIISSTCLYLVEHNEPNTLFTSIPEAFWWGIATLTTIGYGDMVPVTPLGQFFGAITAILGVGIFALPTGLIGASFFQEVTIKRDKVIRSLGNKIENLQDLTEEHKDTLSRFLRVKQNRIQTLEEELLALRLFAEKKGIDISEFDQSKE